MPRGAIGESNEFSRAVARAVDELRDEGQIPAPELIKRAGMSATYYYRRVRGEAPFNTNDLASLASGLGIELGALWGRATAYLDEQDSHETLPIPELRDRVRKLIYARQASDGSRSVLLDLSRSAAARTSGLTVPVIESLLESPTATVAPNQIAAISAYFNVPNSYLTQLELDPTNDAIDAEIDLRSALYETGALGVSGRSATSPSPSSRRALAKMIRKIGRRH